MNDTYRIFWEYEKEHEIEIAAPFLQMGIGVFYSPNAQWPNGYKTSEQSLNTEQFTILDNLANQHVIIECVRGPYPPYSPTGR